MTAKQIIDILKAEKKNFHPVVPFIAGKDKLLEFDFTENNKELTDEVLTDTASFISWVNKKLENANARYGVGGYAEHRTVYRVSKLFGDNVSNAEEPRRLHLGMDIWGKPYTKIMAPLDGIVHSFAFNNNFGDYGATIILVHSVSGFSFYTLYGHLSLNSIKNLTEGERIQRADVFAEFGIPAENGQWPPHLHFQIIIDIGEWKGDYPGVCRFSEKEKFLSNSPDPDLIINWEV